jgi:hypothetical protein
MRPARHGIAIVLMLLGCLHPGHAASEAGSEYEASAQALLSCLNSNQPEEQYNSWQSAMSDQMSAVPIGGAWWSKKAATVPLTIITQLSLDRLGQLQAQVGASRGVRHT